MGNWECQAAVQVGKLNLALRFTYATAPLEPTRRSAPRRPRRGTLVICAQSVAAVTKFEVLAAGKGERVHLILASGVEANKPELDAGELPAAAACPGHLFLLSTRNYISLLASSIAPKP